VLVLPRTESDESVSLQCNEPEVKPGLEAELPELPQECFLPVLDKNETVVSNDIRFLNKCCLISYMPQVTNSMKFPSLSGI
jgi:hypothetical protein